MKEMVGTRRLELLTSTVSRLRCGSRPLTQKELITEGTGRTAILGAICCQIASKTCKWVWGLNRGGSAPFIVKQFTPPRGSLATPPRNSRSITSRSTRPRSGQRLGQLLELSVFCDDFRSCRSRAVVGFGRGAPAGAVQFTTIPDSAALRGG
jgi:hypothetical protein